MIPFRIETHVILDPLDLIVIRTRPNWLVRPVELGT